MRICITCDGISETDAAECAYCGTRLLSRSEVHFPVRRGEADAGHPMLGKTIGGKYRLQGVLGKGGMGTVFRAVHDVSFVPVALKLLHKRYASRPEYRRWFLAEARKAGRVTHEHSARIQDVGETDDGTVFIAMELATGPPLSAWLAKGEKMPANVVVEILSQIVGALDAAHAVGVVHRDLSPRNVAISIREGAPFVKVLDFGIAKGAPATAVQLSDEVEGLASAPTGYANPAYSAPEHLAGEDADARADLYSLGVIAYHALAGSLPVRGASGDALAAATIAGHVARMTPAIGLPTRLMRLVNSLLSHKRDSRPASAAAVASELRRIGEEGEARTLRTVAVVVAMFAVALVATAFTQTFRGERARYLLASPSSPISLSSTPEAVRTVALRREEIELLRFDYGGFDAYELQMHLSGEGWPAQRLTLEPPHDDRVVTLTVADAGFQEAVRILTERSRTGPVDIAFQVPGQRPLRYARVRIDDDQPLVRLVTDGAAGSAVLNGATRFELEVDDGVGRVVSSELVARVRGEEFRAKFEQRGMTAHELFGSQFEGVLDHGAIELHAESEDDAGNVGRSSTLRWSGFDLRAPQITGAPRLVTFDRAGAAVWLQLDATEPELAVQIEGPEGVEIANANVRATGPRLRFVMQPRETLPAYVDGPYSFQLIDAAGNRSDAFARDLRLEESDAQPRFFVADGAVARWRERDFVSDGSACVIRFECNSLYRPRASVVRDPAGRDEVVAISAAADGAWTLSVPALRDGAHTLHVELDADSEDLEGPAVGPVSLYVRRAPEVLQLPSLEGLRFLNQLTDVAAARHDGDLLSEGAAWSWSVPDTQMLSGSIWFGDRRALERRDLDAPERAGDVLVRGVPLRQGENTIYIELRDLLGREVRVQHGDHEAPLSPLIEGRRAYELLSFYHHPFPCASVRPSIAVEHGEVTKLTLRCALPFSAEDGVRLVVDVARLAPRAVRAGDQADERMLDFLVPYDRIASAAGFGAITAEQFRERGRFMVPARLESPAGLFRFQLPMVPVRSSLTPIRIEDAFDAADEVLAAMRFVPALAPSKPFADPVPDGLGPAAMFRPLPRQAVRNIGDVFLQQAEMTRREWSSIVEVGLARQAASAVEWREFVHAADRLGPDRLHADELRPVRFADDGPGWRAACAVGPDRSVAGIDFFQAYTVARLAGFAIAGDPALLRLPMGAELEAAALGVGPSSSLRLNGADEDAPRSVADFRAGADIIGTPESWPLTAEQCRAFGDAVRTVLGHEIVGLDFGVREWVGDLPYSNGIKQGTLALLREWLGDHTRHLQRVEDFARGEAFDVEDLGRHFERVGVIRGLAFGEASMLIDGATGRPLIRGRIGASVPGVVRCLNVRRDGREPSSDALDRIIPFTGMRLAGGSAFVSRVRSR